MSKDSSTEEHDALLFLLFILVVLPFLPVPFNVLHCHRLVATLRYRSHVLFGRNFLAVDRSRSRMVHDALPASKARKPFHPLCMTVKARPLLRTGSRTRHQRTPHSLQES